MKRLFFYGLVLACISFACQNKKDIAPIDLIVDTLTLDHPQIQAFNTFSVVKDRVYFAEFNTRKQIASLKLKDKSAEVLNLHKLYDSIPEGILTYNVISRDSVLLLSKYTNKLYLINRELEILKKWDFQEQKLKGHLFLPPLNFTQGKIQAAIVYAHNSQKADSILSLKEIAQNSFTNALVSPIFLEFNLSQDTLNQGNFLLKNIMSRFLDSTHYSSEGRHFTYNSKNNIYTSSRVDSLFVINNTNLSISSFQLNSKFFDSLKISPVTVDKLIENEMKILTKGARCASAHYSPTLNTYFVFLADSRSGKKVIQLYSSSQQLIHEEIIDKNILIHQLLEYDGSVYLLNKTKLNSLQLLEINPSLYAQ